MHKKVYINLILIIVLIDSCSYQYKTILDPNFTSEIQETYRTTRNWINKDSIRDAFSYQGEALIERKIFSIDSSLIAQEDVRDVILFMDHSRKILEFFPGYGSILNYRLSKSSYRLKIHYWHPQRDYGDKGIYIDISESSLKLNKATFQLGDTLIGHIKIITKPHEKNNKWYYDTYEGDFTSIVFSKDSVNKYPVRVIM